ncbi:MAG: HAD family hydrolase [Patescibacteria group bacterium]
MEKTCVVDFDETLLTLDSTRYMLIKERLYLRLPILFFGLLFLLARALFPRTWQVGIRRRAKYATLLTLHRSGEDRVIQKYSKDFSQRLNTKLIDTLRHTYQNIYVVSSAWRPLIQATLAEAGIADFQIIGTELTNDFSQFSTCWGEEKARRVQALALLPFDLYTDSKDDAPLMRMASNVIMV